MTHGTFDTEKDKPFLMERSGVDRILFESEVTQYLKEEIERCNPLLKSFQLRLEME